MPGWNEGMRLLVALVLAAGSFLTTAQHADALSPRSPGAQRSERAGAPAVVGVLGGGVPEGGVRAEGDVVLLRMPEEVRWGCLYWRFTDHERFLRRCA